MLVRHLHTRFVLAGVLLILTTVISSAWSIYTFARLRLVVDDTLRESQTAVDLSAELASSLEREDDALLVALGGNLEKARRELSHERQRGNECYQRLLIALRNGDTEERQVAARLQGEIARYRGVGDELLALAGDSRALERYHLQVNPQLRQAVASCSRLREENFQSMQAAGIGARDEARRATWFVSGIAVLAILVALVVGVWLARSVLIPVRELSAGVEAIRQGEFDRRVPIATADELGKLAAGFNRMAEALGEYRRSSLGELLTAKATLEATIHALPDAVLVVAPSGQIAAANPLARTILAAKHVPAAQQIQDLPLSVEQRTAIDAALAGRPSHAPRTDFNRALSVLLNERPHRFLLTAVPIPEFAPGRSGAVVVLDDVTEFAQLDELRGELIGVASHELKTPLTTLRMNLLMLDEQAETLSGRQQQVLRAALGGCEELGSTIDELLDVTRIEAGQLRLNLVSVDVRSLVEQVRKVLQPRFDDAQVQLKIVCKMPSPRVKADAARLGSVLTNLLTNALKYSPPGRTVEVRLASGQIALPNCGNVLQVTVTDQGPGVPAEFRDRIFEKFFRVEHHVDEGGKGVRGTGIGLYLCREIIKAHGGTIRCSPGNGGIGTQIAFSLTCNE